MNTTYMQVEKGSEVIITLGEKSLEIFSWSNNKYLDEEKGIWEDKFFYNKANIHKSIITEIDVCFMNKEGLYQVQVKPSDNFLVFFKDKNEANALYNKLTEWRNQ
ncbi:MAG: hypothetical protein WAS34_18840 [Thiolinea sp.]